uniref:Neuropeptides capa receptor n=1 Tax=Cacopsylla melanoneura TaxID=428564 RepID=A0A8D9E4J6_9HEMI
MNASVGLLSSGTIDLTNSRDFISIQQINLNINNSVNVFSSRINVDDVLNESVSFHFNRSDFYCDIGSISFYTVFITIVHIFILIGGIIGNICTCIIISKNKHMQTATNYYLFSLAVSDLLLLVIGLPSELIHTYYLSQYAFGSNVCVLFSFLSETASNATVLTITAFTVERYIAICHPFLSHTVSKLSRAIKFIVCIWLMSLCLAVPLATQYSVIPQSSVTVNHTGVLLDDIESISAAIAASNSTFSISCPVVSTCTIRTSTLWEHAFEVHTCIFFIAPMTLITILYILIGFKLRHSNLLRKGSIGSHCDRQRWRNQSRVINMLIAVVVAFFICWAPFHAQRIFAFKLYLMYENAHEAPPHLVDLYDILSTISGILYYLSPAVNPFLYNIMSNKFREAFKCTFSCVICFGVTKPPSRIPSMYSSYPLRSGTRLSLGEHRLYSRTRPTRSRLTSVVEPSEQLVPLQFSRSNSNSLAISMFASNGATTNGIAVPGPPKRSNTVHTISNSSLQDLDQSEFSRNELVLYLAELNKDNNNQ